MPLPLLSSSRTSKFVRSAVLSIAVAAMGGARVTTLRIALILLLPTLTFGATKTWDGGAASANWGDGANWNADGTPTSSDAVLLNNVAVNPVPQLNAQSGANCGTLTIDGVVNSTIMNYGGATPLVTNLYGTSVNAANTGPLLSITANAPTGVTANKVNFQLRTNGELFVAAGKTLTLSNSHITQNGTRTLTKTGAGTVSFSGSGSQATFTGGFNMAEGVWNAGTDTLDLPTAGLITFTNAAGVVATITSTNAHSIGGLAGGNSASEIYTTGGLTITGTATTTFSGRIRGATKLTQAGTGSLTLNGSNTFTGVTTISSGTLALGSGGSISSSASVEVATGAVLNVSALAAGFTVGNGKTISGGGTVTGKLTAASGATVSPAALLTVSNGFTLAAGAHLALNLNGAANHDAVVVSGGNVTLAGDFAGSTLGYVPAIGDTLFILRNNGSGTTTGSLGGVGDGGKIELGGKWFRVSFTASFGGGAANDVALQRIDDPTPSGVFLTLAGAAEAAVARLSFTWLDNATTETGYQVFRVLSDGSLELAATLPANATSVTDNAANYTSHTYAVQAFNATGPVGDLARSAPFQAGTSLAQRQDMMLDYLSTDVPNLGQFGGGPHRIGRTGFFSAEARLLRGDTATGLSYITTAIEDASAEASNAGFSMWPGMDTYARWNTLFPQSLKDRFQQVYTSSDLYDNGATPNQRFMLATASWMANGVWGTATNSVSGASYGSGDPTGKSELMGYLDTTWRRGFSEHNSNHYLQYTIAAMETLSQFAPDAASRNKARMNVDWGMAEAAGYWLNGHWCVASTRGGTQNRQNEYDITPKTWWLLFGGPTPGDQTDTYATMPFMAPEFPGVLPEITTAARDRTRSFTRRSLASRRVSGFEAAYFKQAWMTPGYGLWSQVEGTMTFNADNSMALQNVNTTSIQDGYQGQRWGLAWDSLPGMDSQLVMTTPTTYSGTTGGISIYEDTLQHEDTMVAVYNIPATGGGTGNDGSAPNQWLDGHIPAGYTAITNESATTGRIFLHYDSVLVAVYLSNPFTWTTDFTTPCSKAGLAIETAAVGEYPQASAAARLAAFRADVLSHATDATHVSEAAPRLIYTNRHGDLLDLTYGLAGKINSVTVDYQSWPMLEDPWMYQAQDGHLHIFGDNRTVVNNYRDWTRNINTRPVLFGNTAVSTVASSPVDVDLTARVADSETIDANLAFKVSNATGGTVALLADGRTARFIPTPGASGPAGFSFTANDRGVHPRVVWHYDFESTTTRDASGQARDATLSVLGTGGGALQADRPAALGTNGTQSLRLTETSPNAARLTRLVTRGNLEMSNGSWTFATWFKRASRTTEDFLFYIGAGDGFGGNGDELQLRCSASGDTLRLEHYNAANTADLTLISPGTAVQNVWHHAAITFDKAGDNTGSVRLYLNGVLVGVPTTVNWALRQDLALVIGGITSTATGTASRYFNGWLDDAALFRGAMTAPEIASLANQSVATFSGLSLAATVPITVLTQQETWRQQYFNTTLNFGPAADLADPDGDGESNLLEFATAQNPLTATKFRLEVARTPTNLEFTYPRSKAALSDGLNFAVEWSDSLALASWSRVGVTEQILSETGTTQLVKASFTLGTAKRRFVRLKVF